MFTSCVSSSLINEGKSNKYCQLFSQNIDVISDKMYKPLSLLEGWTQENNELVNNLMQQEAQNALSRDHVHPNVRRCASEFHKLLRKIQGIPAHADHAELELSVVFNSCTCCIAQSQFMEAELLITQAMERFLQVTGGDAGTSDPLVFWRNILKSVGNTALHPFVLYLVCLQWAIWLATCQLKTIKEFLEEMPLLFDSLTGGFGDSCRDKAKEKFLNLPRLVMDPRRLVELLQICTAIAQGAEMLNEGCSSEALSCLQAASTMPAPRALVAYTHFLSGSCLAHMSRPQMALQCYRKALETDSRCLCALYQSTLIYRQLENIQAEIQALRILHSTLLLPSTTEPAVAGTHLLPPSLLLSSQSLSTLLSLPSPLSILFSLALKCVLHGRVSEGVEHYLDLLAALHSEDEHGIRAKTVHADDSTLPKLPRLYLEAGAALLMAQRPADCTALCNEVISTTQDLLPEKVVLEEPEESGLARSGDMKEECETIVEMLLWVAAAYLLQGHCFTYLKDWKQAVTNYTRCINLLVKVCFKKRGFQPQVRSADMGVKWGIDLCVLKRLKALSFAGRGISFTQMDHLSKALRDLQLSLQVLPEYVGAGLWCGEVLWRLGRKQEAAACWEKTWSLPTQSLAETFPLYVQEHQWGPLLDSTELRHRVQELYPILSA
ncbi:Fanconi anemia group G protein isoform X2 [Melanotaenia boesemani]|uniref:Fanconi anemia group G protein isoform X2 n=1 Tax=Melanotaenia boesemani TaxID=1250792 RepID=UPI001C041E97|nr:Fanconi anemia group G protein isoform X2 [Melanotaenia boesemani]